MKSLFLLPFFITQLYAQTQFQVAVGSYTCDNEWCAIKSIDGGYVLGGSIQYSANPVDMYITKLDSGGILQWTKKIGGVSGDVVTSIAQTTDSSYVVFGQTASFGAGQNDMFILKLSVNGTLQWCKTVGDNGSDGAGSIIQAADGGYIAVGSTNSFGAGQSDMFIVKLNSNGTFQWSKTAGGTGSDYANSIIQTTDGGYITLGSTNSFGAGQRDLFILKLGTNGALQWCKTVGGAYNDYAGSIIQTTDGGYAVTGETYFGSSSYNIFAAKLDSAGNIQWSNNYNNSIEDNGFSIIQTSDGGYVIGGDSENGQYYGCLIKLSPIGLFQWSKIILCDGRNVMSTADGGYAVSGGTDLVGAGCSDFFIVRFDANWNTCQTIGQPTFTSVNYGTTTSPIPTVSSQNPVVSTPTPDTGTEGVVTNICTTVGESNIESRIPEGYMLYQNYPNPFNPSTIIKFSLPKSSLAKLTVYDITGKSIQILVNENLEAGSYERTFDASGLSSGMYFYKIVAEGFSEVKKMVLIK